MAGEAARVAVEPSGSERDTMELNGISAAGSCRRYNAEQLSTVLNSAIG
jgi:hypothetical protein